MKLFVRRGDSTAWVFQLLEGADPDSAEPRDISSDFIRFTIKRKLEDLDSEAVIRLSSTTSGISIETQTGDTIGMFTVELAATDTDSFDVGFLGYYDIQFTLDPDDDVVTPFIGTIEVMPDVTINSGPVSGDT